MNTTLPPLALYVHFPWCVRKCPYCDFNSYTLKEALPEERYVEALLSDLSRQAADLTDRPLISIFLGGGTPSLFSPEAIARVLEAAQRAFAGAAAPEVTLEANPGTIERGRFAEYRAAGINRVSLGAQSFDARRLQTLGRIHSPQETRRAAQELHAAGLGNFNLDLMYALPGQDAAGALSDVEEAVALAPAHLSHYQLTLEPGTPFAATPPPGLPDDDAGADMLAACQERIAAAGFAQYEVSGYARPDRECRHNLNYWGFGDYVGIGAGAHGKLSFAAGGALQITRTVRPREPRRYLADTQAAGRVPIAAADLAFEFMLNALRLTGGFRQSLFAARTGMEWDQIALTVSALSAQGLLSRSGEIWRTTPLGLRFLNEVLLRFLPAGPVRSGRLYAQGAGAHSGNERITRNIA